MMRWKEIISRAMVSGSSASVLSTLALLACGQRDCSTVFAPVNAVSHWLWKDRAIRQNGFSLKYTVAGYLIHHAMSVLWAVTYERLVRARHPSFAGRCRVASPASTDRPAEHGPTDTSAKDAPECSRHHLALPDTAGDLPRPGLGLVLAVAAGVAAGACLVDLRCTPHRLTPGFERRLSASSLFLVYAAFGVGLAACDSTRPRPRHPGTAPR